MTRMPIDLSADVVTLTQQLVDIESVSHHEQAIADAVEQHRGDIVAARVVHGLAILWTGSMQSVPSADSWRLSTLNVSVRGNSVEVRT